MVNDAEQLAAWLADRDAKCPVCEYSLRGLDRPACPECNAPLELAVASTNATNVVPWFVAMVALALGAGFDSVVSVLMTVPMFFQPPTAQQWPRVLVMWGTFVASAGVCIAGLTVGYRKRRRWASWSARRRRLTALVIFCATGIGHILVAMFLIWWMR